ncbi:MAG: flagellar motor switch protein FliG [Calditrichia bacterium]
MTNVNLTELTPAQKCAAFLIFVGVERAAKILGAMSEAEATIISLEIAQMDNLSPETLNGVLHEYYQMMISNQYISQGGKDYTRDVLEKVWDTDKTNRFMKQLSAGKTEDVFQLLEKMDEKVLAGLLANEHPQTNALILANLSPARSAQLLEVLPTDSQYEVAYRLATMQPTSPEQLSDVKLALKEQLKFALLDDSERIGGVEAVANILNSVSGTIEKTIIGSLRERQPELASAISELMFSFDDIVLLDDKIVQRILKDVDSKKLALSLKAANDDLQEKVFKNMSERASKMLRDDIEFLGAVRLKEVEDAQREVVETIKKLEAAGEIQITRGEEELVG